MLPRLVADADPPNRAADHVARAILAAAAELQVAFAGGPATWRLLARLARYRLPWPRLCAWQLDERVAPDFDDARHYTQHFARFAVPARLVAIPVDATRDPTGVAAARRYADTLAQPPARGVLDLVVIEVGPAGEAGALFPGSPALRQREGDTVATGPLDGHYRVGLSLHAMARARELVLVAGPATGPDIVRRVEAGDITLPAGCLRHPRATLFAPPREGA